MTDLRVTHSTRGGESYLLRDAAGLTLLYERLTGKVRRIAEPARLVGRGTWLPFDGDPAPIVEEAKAFWHSL
jgi:hypothetical protein